MGFAALSVVTRHLRDALQLVDIRVLNHLLVAGDQSFKRKPNDRRKNFVAIITGINGSLAQGGDAGVEIPRLIGA